MKSYIKGIITGFLISMAVFALPVVAENIDALFNDVRINVNGVDEIQWGENIELDNGETTPSSILYNGTTYLPMRKLGELSGNKIYWNGDSRTVSMTGAQKDIEVIAEKPDKNGNVWTYYTFKDDNHSYLGVKDEARGYERVYQVIGDVYATESEICFIKITGDTGYPDTYRSEDGKSYCVDIMRLSFECDENSQDGEKLHSVRGVYEGGVLEGGYAYYVEIVPQNSSYSKLNVYNYITGESASYKGIVWDKLYVKDIQNDTEKIIFDFLSKRSEDDYYEGQVVFNKEKEEFTQIAIDDKVAE